MSLKANKTLWKTKKDVDRNNILKLECTKKIGISLGPTKKGQYSRIQLAVIKKQKEEMIEGS